jgi:hypothetical protein
MTAIRASHRKEAQLSPNPLMWLLYLADAASGLAWTVLIVEGAGVI